MLSEFEIHDFPAIAVLPYAEPARADPAAAALAIRKISKAYNFKVNLKELLKDAKLIEREYDHKCRLTKSHERLYASRSRRMIEPTVRSGFDPLAWIRITFNCRGAFGSSFRSAMP